MTNTMSFTSSVVQAVEYLYKIRMYVICLHIMVQITHNLNSVLVTCTCVLWRGRLYSYTQFYTCAYQHGTYTYVHTVLQHACLLLMSIKHQSVYNTINTHVTLRLYWHVMPLMILEWICPASLGTELYI